MKFQTNLREVLLFIKYSKDKEKLKEILECNRERFQEAERRAAEVIMAGPDHLIMQKPGT